MGIHSEVGTGSPVEQSTFLWEVMNKRMEHLGVLGLVASAHRGSEYPPVRMGCRGLRIKKGSSHFLPQPETSHNPQAALSRLCRHVVENGEFSKFCENVVQAFVQAIGVYPPESLVEFTVESMGVASSIKVHHPTKPVVMLYAPWLSRNDGFLVNLARDSKLEIIQAVHAKDNPEQVLASLSLR